MVPLTKPPTDIVERSWARLGVLLNAPPARRTPDLERLLLETAARCDENARLLPLTVTWLSRFHGFVARHRLKRLIGAELDRRVHPILGLILESAIEHGAPRDLAIAAAACRAADPARPLHSASHRTPALIELARQTASPLARRWGVWTPEIQLKPSAIRPGSWVLEQNPTLRSRIIRKGDLRASIIETLRLDLAGGRARSESELARLCGATRAAVRRALAALEQENAITIGEGAVNDRDRPVSLRAAA